MFPGVGQDEGGHLPGLVNLGVLPTATTGLDWLIVEIPTKDFSGKEKRKINFLENDEKNIKNHVVLNFHATKKEEILKCLFSFILNSIWNIAKTS